MYESLALLAGFVLVYSTVAGAIERSWVSGPMVFTAFGLLIGPEGLDLLSFEADGRMLRTLAELTLAVVLFTDAADADLSVLRRALGLPARLLLVGLPLTIGLGFLVGQLVGLPLAPLELALVAVMLAPTDAALGKAVVSNEAVPDEMRQGLNLESGLNDGICVPLLFVVLTLAQDIQLDSGPWELALRLVAEEIGIGLAVGTVGTVLVVELIKLAAERHWLTPTWIQIPVIALAFACFATAQLLGGSGFIAAFSGGLLFGGLERRHRAILLRAADGTADTLALITWVIFGSAVIGRAVGYFSWSVGLYAMLSLTVVRMLPVFVSLAGSKLSSADKLFMGWFGPRGLASIVFAVVVLEAKLPGGDTIAMIVTCTIGLSIVAHGISANPWANRYGRKSA
jgi:NhaP-type Na+/H+ or K+/H+ antiporter